MSEWIIAGFIGVFGILFFSLVFAAYYKKLKGYPAWKGIVFGWGSLLAIVLVVWGIKLLIDIIKN